MGTTLSHFLWGPVWTPSRIVHLRQGAIRGKSFTFDSHSDHPALSSAYSGLPPPRYHTIDAFLNIPFGEPPTGEWRFRRSRKAGGWAGVLDCTQFGPRCPHEDMSIERWTVFLPKSEDCLRLNVFAPAPPLSEGQQTAGDYDAIDDDNDYGRLPVMVFIHGGGFAIHSAAHYGDHGICRNLCRKGVIVVTVQYRLGFFGFLCTGDEAAPGNYGLWDQCLALEWVRDNIAAFGGDPNNVTVVGQSAGAASADFLSLSPYSRDLFHRMILMSGSSACTFALNSPEHIRDVSWEFATQLGFHPTASNLPLAEQNRQLVDFFRRLPVHALEISLVGKRGHRINQHGLMDLTPVLDGDFLPCPLEQLRREAPGKEVIVGVTEYESLLFAALRPVRGSFYKEVFRVVARDFERRGVRFTEKCREEIAHAYFDDIEPSNRKAMTRRCMMLASDVFINQGVWQVADELMRQRLFERESPSLAGSLPSIAGAATAVDTTTAKSRSKNRVYLYVFEHFNPAGYGLAGLLFPFKGATHCSELPYLFGRGVIANFHPSEPDDLEAAERLTTLFTNFARCGQPTPAAIAAAHYRPSLPGLLGLRQPSKKEQRWCWEPLSEEAPDRYFAIGLRNAAMRMREEGFRQGLMPEWRRWLGEGSRYSELNGLDDSNRINTTTTTTTYATAIPVAADAALYMNGRQYCNGLA